MRNTVYAAAGVVALFLLAPASLALAQVIPQPAPAAKPAQDAKSAPAGIALPSGYVIGPDDELTVKFWRDPDLSADVVVRSDGKISVSLLNDIQAAGYTPLELASILEKAATKYVTDPNATVIVRGIRSRKVFVIGQGVTKSGALPLNTEMNVLQALAMSGGLLEYADKDNITIIRREKGGERRFKFNYNEVVRGKNAKQNIVLQPDDTIVVN